MDIEEKSLDELLDDVERMESDFRKGKISEDEIKEYMLKIASHLNIPTEKT